MTDATSGAGTAYHPGAHGFNLSLKWGSCCSIVNFMCVFCRLLFVLVLFTIVLSVHHCVIFSPLCYLFTIVLSVHHCVICSPLCYLFTIVLSFHHCVICSPLCYLFTIVLSFHHCVIFSQLCYLFCDFRILILTHLVSSNSSPVLITVFLLQFYFLTNARHVEG